MRKIKVISEDNRLTLQDKVNGFMQEVASKNPRCVGFVCSRSDWYTVIVEYDA